MPRTKAESTADAVEEQKTDAVEDTAPVQAEEPKAPAESEYTIEELADGAGNIFKVQRECVVAALKVAGRIHEKGGQIRSGWNLCLRRNKSQTGSIFQYSEERDRTAEWHCKRCYGCPFSFRFWTVKYCG